MEVIFFVCLSLFCFIKWIIIMFLKFKYIKIDGVVISADYRYFIKRGELSLCEYKFIYNQKEYETKDRWYNASGKLKIDDKVILYVDKENPNKVLTPGNIRDSKLYFLGFILSILAIICFQ